MSWSDDSAYYCEYDHEYGYSFDESDNEWVNEYQATTDERLERESEREKDRERKYRRLGNKAYLRQYHDMKGELGASVKNFHKKHDSKDIVKLNYKLFDKLLREKNRQLRTFRKEQEESRLFQELERKK